MTPARLGLAPSSVTVLPVAELNKTVSPAMPWTPGAPMTVCVLLLIQFPLVFQEPSLPASHWACPESVTPAVTVWFTVTLTLLTAVKPPGSAIVTWNV